jgi:hypothetical protein
LALAGGVEDALDQDLDVAVVEAGNGVAEDAQNAASSSRVRSRRRPVPGSSAQTLLAGVFVKRRRRVTVPLVNRLPGSAAAAEASSPAAASRLRAAAAARAGRTGSRSRVRWSVRDLRRASCLAVLMSSRRTGQGAAHGPQRARVEHSQRGGRPLREDPRGVQQLVKARALAAVQGSGQPVTDLEELQAVADGDVRDSATLGREDDRDLLDRPAPRRRSSGRHTR